MKNIFKYILTVASAIIEVIIVIIILDNTEYSANSDIMSALVLIYASLRTFGISIGMTIGKLAIGLSKDIIDIKERIRPDYDIEEDKETLKTNAESFNKTQIKIIIRGIGVFIIYLIALSSLLG